MKNDENYGPTVLRVSLGIILVAHSLYLKLIVFGLNGTAGFFEQLGLPGILAYIVFIAEAIGGIMLIIGLKTRYAALSMVPILLGATWAHLPNGWLFTAKNGGWEYPLLLTTIAVAITLMGPGHLSFDSKLEPKNRA